MRLPLLVIAMLVAAAAAGCGKSEQEKQAPPAKAAAEPLTKGAPPAAGGAPPAAQSAQQGAQPPARGSSPISQSQANATTVDFEVLKTLVPEISGWTRGEVRGEQLSMDGTFSKASARYEKGHSSFTLEIVDSSYNQLVLAPMTVFMTVGHEERSDDGYSRAITLAGSPGFEKWRKNGSDGEVGVIIAGRFVVNADGNQVENIDVLKNAVQAVDLNKLARMK